MKNICVCLLLYYELWFSSSMQLFVLPPRLLYGFLSDSCPGTYLGDGATDRCEILHDGTYKSWTLLLPFWGRYPEGPPKFEILAFYKRMSRKR